MQADLEFRLAELERRQANMLRDGAVAEVDLEAARVRVQYGTDDTGNPITTGWLPWYTRRAGTAIEWWPPEVGEQVTILSPSGDLVNGRVLPALYSTAHPAPSNVADIRRADFGDGSYVEYDRAAHKLTVTVNGGDVLLNTTGNLDAAVGGNADVTAGGDANVSASGNVNLDGAEVVMNQGSNGGVVCQMHTCSFTGSPHPQGSSTVKAG